MANLVGPWQVQTAVAQTLVPMQAAADWLAVWLLVGSPEKVPEAQTLSRARGRCEGLAHSDRANQPKVTCGDVVSRLLNHIIQTYN